MKLHSCSIPSPLTGDMKLLEGRKDSVIYMREQGEEGREEPQADAAVLMWNFEFSSRTRTLLSHQVFRDLGLHQYCAPRTTCIPRYLGLEVLSVSGSCPQISLSQNVSGAAEADQDQGSTERDVPRGSNSFWVKRHDLFHGRGKLRASPG